MIIIPIKADFKVLSVEIEGWRDKIGEKNKFAT